jgi:hypothetical protein
MKGGRYASLLSEQNYKSPARRGFYSFEPMPFWFTFQKCHEKLVIQIAINLRKFKYSNKKVQSY